MTNAPRDLGERQAGRGGVYVLFAKAFFILTGFLQQTLLQRYLGDATYGALARVFAAANIPNNVMVASSTQGVSRAIAGAKGNESATLRVTLRIHLLVSLFVGVAFAACTPAIAWFQHAPHIRAPLWVMSGVLAIYGVYAALVGYLNGRALFGKQASLDVLAATLRTIGLLLFGLVAVSLSASAVFGATVGAIGAIACVFGLAVVYVWRDAKRVARQSDGQAAIGGRSYLRGLLPVIGAQAFTSALMQADILLLGHFLAPTDAGSAGAADEWVAAYRGAQLFAFLPYQLLFSVTQVLFPLLAKTRATGTPAEVKALVERGSRIGVLVLTVLVCVVAALPGSLLRFAYTETLAKRATGPLSALALGQACFAVLGLANTVLVSLGHEVRSLALTGVAVVLVTGSAFVFASHAPFGADVTLATARSTSFALAAAAVGSILVVRRTAGAFAPLRTLVSCTAVIALVWITGSRIPMLPRMVTLVAAPAVAIVAIALLALVGAVGRADIDAVKSLVRKKQT